MECAVLTSFKDSLLWLGAAALIGLDSKISFERMRQFGPMIELNPLVRYFAKKDLRIGIASLLGTNAILLLLVMPFPTLIHVLFGLKLGLATLQLKSLMKGK